MHSKAIGYSGLLYAGRTPLLLLFGKHFSAACIQRIGACFSADLTDTLT